MKTQFTKTFAGLAAAITCALCTTLSAQVTVTETRETTSSGTITQYAPGGETIVLRQESSAGPGSYYVTRQTTFVDEDGQPVVAERVVSGAPVTVHYVRDGSRMVASRVVVRRTTSAPVAAAPAVTETTRTTTTTTTGSGTFDQYTPGAESFVIRSSSGPQPYVVSRSTTYVDESGAPVTVQNIAPGAPVTVHYTREGDRLVATRVIVTRTTTTQPVRPLTEDEKERLEEEREEAKERREEAREEREERREERRERRND